MTDFDTDPLVGYTDILHRLRVQTWADFASVVRGGATAGRVAGIVAQPVDCNTLVLRDSSGEYEVLVSDEAIEQYYTLLKPGTPLLLMLTAVADDDAIQARVLTVEPLDKAAERLRAA